jgi:hypothetical protein
MLKYKITLAGTDITSAIELLSASFRLAGRSTAAFQQRYGILIDQNGTQAEPLAAIAGKVLKVQIWDDATPSDTRAMFVSVPSVSDSPMLPISGHPSGDATFNGVEYFGWMLNEVIPEECPVEKAPGVCVVIRRLLSFNSRTEESDDRDLITPNKAKRRYSSSPVFSLSEQAEEWTAAEVAELLFYQFYRQFGHKLTWGPKSQHEFIRKMPGKVWDLSGKTYRAALDELFDSKGGWCWTIGGSTGQQISVQSTSLETVSDIHRTYLPANPVKFTYDVDLAEVNPTVTLVEAAKYDTIEVIGGRLRCEFSASFTDGILEPAWDKILETEYIAAKDETRGEDKYENLWCAWKIKADWNGVTKVKGAYIPAVNPTTGKIATTSQKCLPAAWVIEHERPTKDAGAKTYSKPIVWCKDVNDDWIQIDKPPKGEIDGMTAVSVAVDGANPIIHVRPSLPHLFAPSSVSIETDQDPVYDYTTAVATISVQTDEWFRLVIGTGKGRRRRISVPEAKLWVRLKGTMIGLETKEIDGSEQQVPKLTEKNEVLKHDIDLLRAVANLAKSWYGRRRVVVSGGQKTGLFAYSPGNLVSEVKRGTTVLASGAVLTEVTYDLRSLSCSFTTDLVEPDFAGIFSNRRNAPARIRAENALRGARPVDVPTGRLARSTATLA